MTPDEYKEVIKLFLKDANNNNQALCKEVNNLSNKISKLQEEVNFFTSETELLRKETDFRINADKIVLIKERVSKLYCKRKTKNIIDLINSIQLNHPKRIYTPGERSL